MLNEDWWMGQRRISVVVDPKNDWIIPFAKDLVARVEALGRDKVVLLFEYEQIEGGDIAFFLGCLDVAGKAVLAKHKRNLVVHESALPKGRGFSPLMWQVLEGATSIPISLIEAAESADEGAIYLQREIALQGDELNDELRQLQGEATVALCLEYLCAVQEISPRQQQGASSWYRRRTAEDSQLDLKRNLQDQFDLLRTVDNERYPAFFDYRGHRYRLTIEKVK